MLASKKKLVLIIMIIFIMSFVSVGLFAECDMFGMLSTFGCELHEFQPIYSTIDDDPFDFIWDNDSFLYDQIGENVHGYGIIYYNNGDTSIHDLGLSDPDNQVFRSFAESPNFDPDFTAYYTAKDHIYNIAPYSHDAAIVLGHARQATTGNNEIPDPHPFVWDYDLLTDPDVPCYTFEHNGTITSSHVSTLLGLLGQQWQIDHPFTTSPTVDSEVYFHWIIYNIEQCNGNVMLGLHNAVKYMDMEQWTDTKNFIFSDGNAMYAFRDYGNGTSTSYYLGYYDGLESDDNPFRSVRTDYYTDTSNLEEISLDELVYIPRQGDIMKYEQFNNPNNEVSGIVSGTWSSNNSPYYVVGDVTVNTSLTIESNAEIFFLDECEFTINGTVTLEEDATFNISHCSDVIINDGGTFALDWGSTITGAKATVYPGEGQPPIPGDRIIAQNGGRISSDPLSEYYQGAPKITIYSSSGVLWDGIFIYTPEEDDYFWFVNCEIKGISKLSIENIGLSTGNPAFLKLHYTDFKEAGQIVIQDGHELTIAGSDTSYCYIQDNIGCPINAYESPVFLDYVWIGGDGYENNGAGIYLYGSSSPLSDIKHSKIYHNTGNGATFNGVMFNYFTYNNIEYNDGFGMLCYKGTTFDYEKFYYLTLYNNGSAEYAGNEDTFQMGNRTANININDSNYGIGFDQYLLMNFNWNGTDPVDIRGTNLTSYNLSHLSPSNLNAWTFGGGITDSREMLNSASNDISFGNYALAEDTLQELITLYPDSKEAGSAVYYLYHLETLSNQDFSTLRSYFENLVSPANSSLEIAINKIVTKTFMKDQDYFTAIELLEDVITNSQDPDEVVSAMIDEGYCYMKLAEEGERGLPTKCTIKTATLDEYQARVRELETQFSFYPGEGNQDITTVNSNIILHTNHPNPFNPNTTISFDLTQAADVSIEVYNIKGQKVKTLLNEYTENGAHSVLWNGKDTGNKSVASGIYFYKLTADKNTVTKKMLLLK